MQLQCWRAGENRGGRKFAGLGSGADCLLINFPCVGESTFSVSDCSFGASVQEILPSLLQARLATRLEPEPEASADRLQCRGIRIVWAQDL
jgi:hypothetical protein